MATTALRLPESHTTTDVSAAPDVYTRLRRLERDNKSLALRNAALLRAINGAKVTTTQVTRVKAPDGLVQLARTIEAAGNGKLPAVRFVRDEAGIIQDLELMIVHVVAEPDELTAPDCVGMEVL